jgi:hypothetical protein
VGAANAAFRGGTNTHAFGLHGDKCLVLEMIAVVLVVPIDANTTLGWFRAPMNVGAQEYRWPGSFA